MIRSALGSALLLLLLNVHDALAAPNARPQTPEQQAQGEANLKADFLAEVDALNRIDDAPTATTLSPAELSSESALLKYYATATFSDLPTGSAYYYEATGTDEYVLPKQTDPCGPAVQDGTEFDTCTVDPDGQENINGTPYVYFADEPAAYGVQCLPVPPRNNSNGFSNAPSFNASAYSLNTTQCEIEAFCEGMVTDNFPKNQWVWNTNGGPDCAVGMWMPAEPGVAKKPDKTRCMYGIFGTMGLYCQDGGPESQIAAVNVRRLPQGSGDTGEAVNAGYPSYLLAPFIFY
ncbi:MAG: hypothetical protein LQ352_008012 [Teloschistes flavicans]|nr:MAG: hypothetical protein LQ352_008012 [Teloschistes flavicans]